MLDGRIVGGDTRGRLVDLHRKGQKKEVVKLLLGRTNPASLPGLHPDTPGLCTAAILTLTMLLGPEKHTSVLSLVCLF